MDEKDQLSEKELDAVSGGGWSDITKWFKKRADEVADTYICENCRQIYTATMTAEAEQYNALGKHLCSECKAKL